MSREKSAPPLEPPSGEILPCLGEFMHEPCMVRVGCGRYQSLSVKNTELVRIKALAVNGCEEHVPLTKSMLDEILKRDFKTVRNRK